MPETDPNTNDESINESERIDPGGTAAAEGVLYHVRAWAEFAAEGEAQLALAEGDVLEVLHEANQDGWGYGYGSGCRTRVFPQRARAPVARARPAWSQGHRALCLRWRQPWLPQRAREGSHSAPRAQEKGVDRRGGVFPCVARRGASAAAAPRGSGAGCSGRPRACGRAGRLRGPAVAAGDEECGCGGGGE
jgi:hypothetical protein